MNAPTTDEGVVPCVLSRCRPLLAQGSTLYSERGLEVHASEDFCESFSKVARCDLDVLQRWTSHVRLLARVGRLGFHALQSLPDGGMVGLIRGHVVHCREVEGAFRSVFRVGRDSRPLGLDVDDGSRVVLGEYFSSAEREAARVYAAGDGISWERVHTFLVGTVRHVNGVPWDPVCRGWLVLTEDEDGECGPW